MSWWPSQKQQLRLVAGASLVACSAGIAYAVSCGTADDAQRGGAVAVALSFLMLFAGHPTAEKTLEEKDEAHQYKLQTATDKDRIDLLVTAATTQLDAARNEKLWLTFSSVLGTLVAGFGDILAAWLGAPP